MTGYSLAASTVNAEPLPPEPPINELPEPEVVDEASHGLARHSVGERVRVLEAVVGQASDALVLSAKDDDDPVIRIRFVNQAFTRLLGFGVADVAGQSPGVLVGPETDLETLRRVEAALRQDETVTAELVLHDADGSPVRVEATYRVVAAGSGASWYLASYRDLSDRVEAAAALRRSEAWAEAMVQGSSDLVMVADGDGVVRYVSPAITEVLGYDPEDFVARVFSDVIHPDDLPRSAGLFEAVRTRRGRTNGKGYQFRVSHRDGGWRTVSLRVADRLDDPAVRGFVVNLRDVSDRQRAEDLLAEQADLLEAIARGAPLDVTLGKITAMVERHVDGVTAVIGMLDDDGVIRLRSTSHLPEEIVQFYDDLPPSAPGGVTLRSGMGEVFVFDLVDGPNLGAAAGLFATYGFTQARTCRLRAPGSGELVGVLTIFHRVAGDLAPSDLQPVQRATNLAAIAIERHQLRCRPRVPGALRPPDRSAQPGPPVAAHPRGARQDRRRGPGRGRAVHRPRPVQGHQRLRWPRHRRRRPPAGGRAVRAPAPTGRDARSVRRRRVHGRVRSAPQRAGGRRCRGPVRGRAARAARAGRR